MDFKLLSTTEDTEDAENLPRPKGERLKVEKQLVYLCFQCPQWLKRIRFAWCLRTLVAE